MSPSTPTRRWMRRALLLCALIAIPWLAVHAPCLLSDIEAIFMLALAVQVFRILHLSIKHPDDLPTVLRGQAHIVAWTLYIVRGVATLAIDAADPATFGGDLRALKGWLGQPIGGPRKRPQVQRLRFLEDHRDDSVIDGARHPRRHE